MLRKRHGLQGDQTITDARINTQQTNDTKTAQRGNRNRKQKLLMRKAEEARQENLQQAQVAPPKIEKQKSYVEHGINNFFNALAEVIRDFINMILSALGIKKRLPSFLKHTQQHSSGYCEEADALQLEKEYEAPDKAELEEKITRKPDLAKRIPSMKRFIIGDQETRQQLRDNFDNNDLCDWMVSLTHEQTDRFLMTEPSKLRKHLAGIRKVHGIPVFETGIDYAGVPKAVSSEEYDHKQASKPKL